MAWAAGWNILPMLEGGTGADTRAISADGSTVVGIN